MKKFFLLFIALVAASSFSFAQKAVTPVSWEPAETLDQLEKQIVSWQFEYNVLVKGVVTSEVINGMLKLNLEKGYIVNEGMKKLSDKWINDTSIKDKKNKYPNIARLFWSEMYDEIHAYSWQDTLRSPIESDFSDLCKWHDYFYEELSKNQQKTLKEALAKTIVEFFEKKGLSIDNDVFVNEVLWFSQGYGASWDIALMDRSSENAMNIFTKIGEIYEF